MGRMTAMMSNNKRSGNEGMNVRDTESLTEGNGDVGLGWFVIYIE